MKLPIESVLISLLLTDDAVGQEVENPIQVSGFHTYFSSYPKIDQRACRLLPKDLGFPLRGQTITYPVKYINGSIIGRLLRRILRHFSKKHCLVSWTEFPTSWPTTYLPMQQEKSGQFIKEALLETLCIQYSRNDRSILFLAPRINVI